MDVTNRTTTNYDETVHKLGRISTLIMIVALISVPLAIGLVFGVEIDMNKTSVAFLAAFSVFGVAGAIEFFSYAPILGAGGQYLSFITGNISNMKLPAALSGIKISKYEAGTKEADVVSTIAIAVSTLMTTAIIFIGMLFVGQFLPILQSPTLTPAFSNLMPALLGALATPFFKKSIKTASAPCIAAAVLTIVLGYSTVARYQPFLMPAFLILAVAWSYILHTREKSKTLKTNENVPM